MTTTSTLRAVLLLLTSAILSAGCAPALPVGGSSGEAAHGPAGTPLPSPPPFARPLTATAVDLVTRSGSYPAGQRVLDRALDRLNRGCLAPLGFRPPPAAPVALPAREDEAAVIDLPRRAERGYGIAAAADSSSGEPADPYVDGLSAAERRRYARALLGLGGPRREVRLPVGGSVTVHAQGCEAESRARLAGDVDTWALLTYVPDRLAERLAGRTGTAPRYVAALDAWRGCMSARGYTYTSPEAATEELTRERSGQESFRRREIAVAVADGECAAQVRLPSVTLAVQRELAGTLPEADLRMLSDAAFRWTAAVERARTV